MCVSWGVKWRKSLRKEGFFLCKCARACVCVSEPMTEDKVRGWIGAGAHRLDRSELCVTLDGEGRLVQGGAFLETPRQQVGGAAGCLPLIHAPVMRATEVVASRDFLREC